jgi:hypothetical protein
MAIAAAYVGDSFPEQIGPRGYELWSVTGSTGADGDTATFTPKWGGTVVAIVGLVSWAQNSTTKVVTITAEVALGNAVTSIAVFYRVGI